MGTTKFKIDGMCCSTEEGLIRQRLGFMPGIDRLEFNLIQRTLTVHHELPEVLPVVAAIKSLRMNPVLIEEPVATTRDAVERYRIEAMDCPTEEGLIRSKLEGMEGVHGLEFNLVQRILTVHHSLGSDGAITSAISSLGMEPVVLGADAPAARSTVERPKAVTWLPLIVAGTAALGAEVTELVGVLSPWLPAALSLFAVGLSGWNVYLKGWISISNKNLNINALMSIAVTGAVILQLWPEAALVIVLFALAERIEGFSLERARKAISGLLSLTPSIATVLQSDGVWKSVPSESVAVGASIRVRPGERISHDGQVLKGDSTVDQSPITGESVPVDKSVGDGLFAGTVNLQGELEFQVTALSSNSTLSRIIHLVEEAQGNRAPTQRFVDRFARIYTPAVFAVAVLVAILPPFLGLGSWFEWIYKALVLMVIACPCALVISTPVTIVSGLSAAARAGILVKGGTFLELGKDLRVIAFDKTGTVTHGKPEQTDFQALAGDLNELRIWAASLASRSDHPVSQALARAAVTDQLSLQDVVVFQAVAGRGVQGTIAGRSLLLGNHRWIEDLGICSPDLESRLEALEVQGKTTVILAEPTQVLALFAVADTVKSTSQQAMKDLHRLGVKSLMLSGDNSRTVQAIARSVGIDDARGEQLPQDKLAALSELSSAGHKVGMVGDGINDAPALARADIGFAMGGAGTGTAIETADVVLMDDDLRKVPHFIALSRKTSSILVQNITFALVIKGIFFALTVVGLGTMWMAVFADMGTSILVVLNGLRLLSGTRTRLRS